MYLVGALVSIALSAGIIVAVLVFFKKRLSSAGGAERQEKVDSVNKLQSEITTILAFSDAYASKGQLSTLSGQLDEVRAAVEGQKNQLKEIEQKLDSAQKQVEEKEAHQQDMKSVKEEDEAKLAEVLAQYESLSSESIALEQQVALSMKNLDQILNEIQLTPEQKTVIEDLSNSLVSAGSRLRDLITEYEVVKERLENLKQQHSDLEEEYTRLVEQQLGE